MRLDELVPIVDTEPLFRQFWSVKRGRMLAKPNGPMQALQRNLLSYLRSELHVFMHSAHGSVAQRSILTNVEVHRYNRYFYVTDITNAYPSVQVERLADMLITYDHRLVGSREEVIAWLTRYCIAPSGGLYQGGAASPMLFNLYGHHYIDEQLVDYLTAHGLAYSRYLDDLTFSHRSVPVGERKRRHIRGVLAEAGFVVSHRKSLVLDLKQAPFTITGVTLQYGGKMGTPGSVRARATGLLHAAQRDDSLAPTANGLLGHVYSATPSGKNAPSLEQLRFEHLRLTADRWLNRRH